MKRKKKFNWLLVGFGPCNKTCGPGFRAPIFRCTRERESKRNPNNEYYSPKRCNSIEKPVFNEQIYKCNLKRCAATWETGEWGKCLCLNGVGISSRNVECVQENATEEMESIESSNCKEMKPPIEKSCECMKTQSQRVFPTISNLLSRNTHANIQKIDKDVSAGVWMTSNWNEKCEGDCTAGIQHRTVVCDRKSSNTNLCDSSVIPSTFQFCKTNKTCTNGEWYTSEWSDCLGECFNLQKTRLVMCIRDNAAVSDEHCDIKRKPVELIKCNISDVNFCGPRWHYSDWTEV